MELILVRGGKQREGIIRVGSQSIAVENDWIISKTIVKMRNILRKRKPQAIF